MQWSQNILFDFVTFWIHGTYGEQYRPIDNTLCHGPYSTDYIINDQLYDHASLGHGILALEHHLLDVFSVNNLVQGIFYMIPIQVGHNVFIKYKIFPYTVQPEANTIIAHYLFHNIVNLS